MRTFTVTILLSTLSIVPVVPLAAEYTSQFCSEVRSCEGLRFVEDRVLSLNPLQYIQVATHI